MPKKGFTIIEMMVAIFFLSVGMTAALIAVQQTMAYFEASSFRLTAIYLAQEGIEIVKNIRDGNWLEKRGDPSVAWDDGLGARAAGWEADYTAQKLNNAYDGEFLLLDGGFYNYSSGNQTLFKRKITISDKDDLDGDSYVDQMKVTVTVSWEAKGSHEISAQEFLYNWRQ